jgi:cyclomaltodextrin glucanotransferase
MNDLSSDVPGAPVVPDVLVVTDVEFRSETIYFLVVDRFAAGSPDKTREDDELFDVAQEDWNKYWGGDLQGIIDRLDYLEQLGISAIWTTPLFEQIDGMSLEEVPRAPIHGYWTSDFKRIHPRWVNDPSEKRLFTRDDTVFDRLLAEMHGRGMKYVLDIVCNHSSPRTRNGKGNLYDDGRLVANFDDDPDHWYHHYGPTRDWADEWQVQHGELGGLADFNENNILFRNHVKEAIALWVRKGVDALRIDTVKHMPMWFWQEFTADLNRVKPDLFRFGEWIYSHPLDARSVDFANRAGMSLLDFGFCDAIRGAISGHDPRGFGAVTELLALDDRYACATELVTFFENHDMPRLQSLGVDNAGVDLALVLLLTARGIPCLYYGCEQYLHNDTDGGNDPYNRPMMRRWGGTEATRIIQRLAAERKANPAVIWGGHWTKWVDAETYVYLRRYRDSRCLVFLNRGAARQLRVEHLECPDGEHVCLLSGERITILDGCAEVDLPERAARVFAMRGAWVEGRVVARVQVNGPPTLPGDRLALIGDVPELGNWDLRGAVELECINSNTWFGEVAFEESAGTAVGYKFVIFRAGENLPPERENRGVRRRLVPVQGATKWRDYWEC